VPGRPGEDGREARRAARCAVSRSRRAAQALGDAGRLRLGELEQVGQDALVRREALLRLARDQGVQDAHPRAPVALPRVHAMLCVRRRAVEARGPALARGRHEPARADAGLGGRSPRILRQPEAAQAGGKSPEQLEKLFEKVHEILRTFSK